jgi:cytochrome c556
MLRVMVSLNIGVFMISCAAPSQAFVETARPVAPLSRFMREEVSVPFSFAMLATASAHRGRRVHQAASMLREAAHDLVHWSDPPAVSEQGQRVFYAYAENLEYHVSRLEHAAANREPEQAADSLEQIRQTCNSCHHFFRPASRISPDVAYDRFALDLGGSR